MAHMAWDILLNAAAVRNVRSVGYNDSAQLIVDRASGQADPAAFFLGNSEPIVNLQSTDIKGLCALNGGTFVTAGLCVTGASTTIPLAKRIDCGVTSAGAVNTSFVGNSVIVIPTQFEVRQDSEEGATCNLEIRFRSSDGFVNPITVSNTHTLAGTTYGQTYSLGRAYVNDVVMPQLTGIVVNTGITLGMQRDSGGIFPTANYIIYREPTIDLLVEDLSQALSFINIHAVANHTVRAFFRARADGAAPVVDATASHLKFSFAAAASRLEGLEAAQTGNGSATIRCHGKVLVAAADVPII